MHVLQASGEKSWAYCGIIEALACSEGHRTPCCIDVVIGTSVDRCLLVLCINHIRGLWLK